MSRDIRKPPIRRRDAKLARRLARRATELEREEDARAEALTHRRAEARLSATIDDPGAANGRSNDVDAVLARQTPLDQRALLIINAKSGANAQSLLHVREIVECLARHGIGADVRVKLKKSVARRQARKAAKRGYPLVIAAGGDGTVAAVARGLVGTNAILGIVPLGTYNNTATSLGIPTDIRAACALIANGVPRSVDVGEVRATGKRRRVPFLEMSAVGLAAALASAGQHLEKRRFEEARSTLPQALAMEPTLVRMWLDGERRPREAHTLLVVVANGPRAGAGLDLAPAARLDDGLLDVHLYEELDQAALAAQFVAAQATADSIAQRAIRSRARKVRVESTGPLPVVADSKVIGMTPASFRIRSGALRVIAGNGPGLARPASDAFMAAIAADQQPPAPNGQVNPGLRTLSEVVPNAMEILNRSERLRTRALPIAMALAGGLALGPLVRRLSRQ